MKRNHKLNRKGRARKQTRILVLFLVAVVLAITLGTSRLTSKPGRQRPLSSETIPSQYSLEEMQGIWSNHFQKIFDQELLVNMYHLPKIQERYNLLNRRISERYHTNLHVSLVTGYLPESRDVLAGAFVNNGQPTLEIIAPRLVDIYKSEQRKNETGWEDTMGYVFTSMVMHELDHLAFGAMKGSREHPLSLDELAEDERNVWALTCENTLRPLVEEYRVRLTASVYIYYNKWVEVGRNADSPLWKDFIYSHYKVTRK